MNEYVREKCEKCIWSMFSNVLRYSTTKTRKYVYLKISLFKLKKVDFTDNDDLVKFDHCQELTKLKFRFSYRINQSGDKYSF